METPSVVYYEHDFNDSEVKSLAKSVLNLGNECRALTEENKRLKYEAVHAAGQLGQQSAEIAYLKEEVERLKAFCTRTIIPNEILQAEVERLNNLIISGGAVNPDASVYP